MILVAAQGGLGNQISQYAFSRLLADRYPGCEIKLDLSWFYDTGREFSLARAFVNTGLQYKLSTPKELEQVTGQWNYSISTRHFVDRVHNKCVRICKKACGAYSVVVEQGKAEIEEVKSLDVQKDWLLIGTWHNIDYLEILPELQKELQFRAYADQGFLHWKDLIEGDPSSVSLHIRCGDYSGSRYDILPGSNYYLNALRYCEEHLKKEIKVYVFSDDIKFAQDYMESLDKRYDYAIVDGSGREDWTDMQLMGLCSANICANSTFSKWGGVLGWHRNKVICQPEFECTDVPYEKNSYTVLLPL